MSRSKRKQRMQKRQRFFTKTLLWWRLFVKRHRYPKYRTTEKLLGETPLIAAERLREEMKLPDNVPLSYAGRLDPMATGKLLVLIGEECKNQSAYHALDKEYHVELLFGVKSDTGDVLGIIESDEQKNIALTEIQKACIATVGEITLPYPHFSSKTIEGKPLHTWALEGRLGEINIPTKTSSVYSIEITGLRTISKLELLELVSKKVESIPKVTDARKQLGADFRREDVRSSWKHIEMNTALEYQVLSYTCIASSGTYMRSLSEHIARSLGSYGLALSIHRSIIGTYYPCGKKWGFWTKKY